MISLPIKIDEAGLFDASFKSRGEKYTGNHSAEMSIRPQLILHIVLLALTYFVVGKLSLLLAIPPGFATPVWPPAGFALAAIMLGGNRLAPGILLGSFGVNLWISAQAGVDVLAAVPLGVAAGIAVGASLQAVLSAWALRHLLPHATRLRTTRDVLVLLLIGGAAGCLVNGLTGPLVLLAAGIIPVGIYSLSAFTWWAGDAIGVVLFAPMLLLIANPGVTTLRKFIVTVPILAFAGLTALLFFAARSDNTQREQMDFARQAQEVTTELKLDLNGYLDILTANENFMASSQSVTFAEFESFTREFLRKYQGIQSLAWIPRIPHAERAAFEESMRASGFPDYQIYDRTGLGTSRPAGARKEYFPVAFFGPKSINLRAAGLDTYGPDGVIGLIRREALDRARIHGTPATTGPVSLVQAENEVGVLVYNPVFHRHDGDLDEGDAIRRGLLMGYVAGVFRVDAMIAKIADHADALGMDLRVIDRSGTHGSQTIFDSQNALSPDTSPADDDKSVRTHRDVLPFAGHEWELLYRQKAAAAVANQSWSLWYLLIGGLLLSALFGSFLMVISAGADDEPMLNVDEDKPAAAIWLASAAGGVVLLFTFLAADADLSQAAVGPSSSLITFERLLLVAGSLLAVLTGFVVYIATVANHRSVMLRHKTHALMAANAELEEFAYRTSHDLRSPLVSSIALVDLTREFFEAGDDKQALNSLGMIGGGLRKLDTLVQDIMTLTRTKNLQEEPSSVDFSELVQASIEHMAHLPHFDRLHIDSDISLPGTLYLRRSRITVIVENLISNAIKYQDLSASASRIQIRARQQAGRFVFEVEDNGLGIPESHHHQLFSMFKRFHSEVSYGSGLGLYMVRKSADVLGGHIRFEALQQGTRFTFSMPWPGNPAASATPRPTASAATAQAAKTGHA